MASASIDPMGIGETDGGRVHPGRDRDDGGARRRSPVGFERDPDGADRVRRLRRQRPRQKLNGLSGRRQNGEARIGAADIAEQNRKCEHRSLSSFPPFAPDPEDQNASSQLRLRRTAELMRPTME